MNNKKYQKCLIADTLNVNSNPLLTIKSPSSSVVSLLDAAKACVIIKRKDKGHGSGFAITNDGYIITNYHVIAGKYSSQHEEIKVQTPNGEELPVKVIRCNKAKDIALLKIDKTFEKHLR